MAISRKSISLSISLAAAAASSASASDRGDEHWRVFERLCLSNLSAPLEGLKVAAEDGYKPFLLPGFMQNNSVDMNVIILESEADGGAICQVVDRTQAYGDPEAFLIQKLSAQYPDFDPESVDLSREVAKYIYELNGQALSFTAQSKAEDETSALGVTISTPN
ncbi:MAG: hypothetical protein AAFN79_00230 [Pseudomonadota bacterium]